MKHLFIYIIIFAILINSLNAQTKQFWLLTGNAATDPQIHFVGTTDANPFVLKVNNQNAGYLSFNSGTSFGFQASQASGAAFGYKAAGNGSNISFGYKTNYAATTGYDNTAIGNYALGQNTSGRDNVAIGASALSKNQTSHHNIAVGAYALFSQISNNGSNTATGAYSLYSNTTGFYNTAYGYSAMHYNISGSYNTAAGSYALNYNTNGALNTAIGYNALYADTGYCNTANGEGALGFFRFEGSYNTAIGTEAGTNAGDNNTAFGYESGNTFTSYLASLGGGDAINILGIGMSVIGSTIDIESDFNTTVLGSLATSAADNEVMLGNTSVTSVKAAGNFIIYSDGRFKKNINENVPGLSFIKLLKPVTYNYDIHALNEHVNSVKLKNIISKAGNGMQKAIAEKEKKIYTGFIAQDIETITDKLHYNFSGLYKPQNSKDAYGLSYADFVVPLVKAVQELSSENYRLKEESESLQSALKSSSMHLSEIKKQLGGLKQAQ
jgi:hypothetical protein